MTQQLYGILPYMANQLHTGWHKNFMVVKFNSYPINRIVDCHAVYGF